MREDVAVAIDAIDAAAYVIPTEEEESDATFVWDDTTLVVAEARAGDTVGLGYTYGAAAAAGIIAGPLAECVLGRSAPCCALARVRHVEYFQDHVLIEQRLFDGAAQAVDGRLRPDSSRPGLGLELKRPDAEGFRVA